MAQLTWPGSGELNCGSCRAPRVRGLLSISSVHEHRRVHPVCDERRLLRALPQLIGTSLLVATLIMDISAWWAPVVQILGALLMVFGLVLANREYQRLKASGAVPDPDKPNFRPASRRR